ncbi:unnamed protein product [Leuciscus chuanchicus]
MEVTREHGHRDGAGTIFSPHMGYDPAGPLCLPPSVPQQALGERERKEEAINEGRRERRGGKGSRELSGEEPGGLIVHSCHIDILASVELGELSGPGMSQDSGLGLAEPVLLSPHAQSIKWVCKCCKSEEVLGIKDCGEIDLAEKVVGENAALKPKLWYLNSAHCDEIRGYKHLLLRRT